MKLGILAGLGHMSVCSDSSEGRRSFAVIPNLATGYPEGAGGTPQMGVPGNIPWDAL